MSEVIDGVERAGSQVIVRDEEGSFDKGTTCPDKRSMQRIYKNLEIREHLDKHAIELLDKAIELAKMGSEPALKMCIDKIIPNKRYDTVKIQLYGKVQNIKDVTKVSRTVLESMCEGIVSPEQAKQVCDVLDIHASNLEKEQIEERIDRIEEAMKIGSSSAEVEHLN